MVVALIAYASPAIAGSWVTTSDCRSSRHYGYISCQSLSAYISDPARDIAQEQRDAAERDSEAVKWEQFCKPKFRVDAYGVRRASYARSGCEFGRSE
jgi:hypothetical protein